MIADLKTVMWKERKALLRPQGSRWRLLFTLLTPVFITILLPLQLGEFFVRGPFVLLLSYLVALIIVPVAIAESFAGERERHTLATLLASRLPDRAILVGKIAVPVVVAWLALGVSHAVALTIANIVHWNGGVQVHPPTILLGILGLGLLLPLIAAGLGIIISLRSATVQGAQQALTMLLLVPLIALQILGAVAFGIGRDRIGSLIELLEQANWPLILVLVLLALALLAAGLLVAATARFQRARLILA